MKKIFFLPLLLLISGFTFSQVKDGDNTQFGVPKVSLGIRSGFDTIFSAAGRSIEFVTGPNSLDGDDLADILVPDYNNGGRVHVFEQVSKGSLEFKLVWQSKALKKRSTGIISAGPSSTPRTITFSDLDGNGKKEILMPLGYTTTDTVLSDTTWPRGIHVYEWTGKDNDYGTDPYIIKPESFDANTKNYSFGRMEKGGLLATDIDNDGKQELIMGSTTFLFDKDVTKNSGKVYIVSIKSGTFASKNIQLNPEYIYTKMATALGDSDGYVPWALLNADVDGDTKDELVIGARVNVAYGAGLGFVKASAKDTYIDGNIIDIGDPTKSVSLQNVFRVTGQMAKYKYQGRDLVIFNTDETTSPRRILMLSDVVDISLVGANNLITLKRGDLGTFTGTAIGDQDHGTGSDGFDIYFPKGITGIYDLEYNGTGNIADSNSYKLHEVFNSYKIFKLGNGGLYHVIVPPSDINNNGKKEIIANFQIYGPDTLVKGNIPVKTVSPFFVIEWGDTNYATVNVQPLSLITPNDYTLEQNYPNPFNPTTNIKFSLPVSESISLIVYDVNGREVRKIIDGKNYEKGNYEIVWDGKNNFGKSVSSGNYFYKLKWGNFEKSMKMTFLK